VPGECLPRGVPRGDDDGGDQADLECHDGAVGMRQACEVFVEVAATQVEKVPDDGQWPRARRQSASTYSSLLVCYYHVVPDEWDSECYPYGCKPAELALHLVCCLRLSRVPSAVYRGLVYMLPYL
jgi:hypothetical protein